MITNLQKRIFTSIILIIFVYFSLKNNFLLILVLSFISILIFKEFLNMFIKIFFKDNLKILSFLIFILFYLIFFSLCIYLFSISVNYKSNFIIFSIISICAATDIGGYAFGKLIGGKKLTKISPNKTYTGTLGSFLFAILTYICIDNFYNLNPLMLTDAFIISFTSQIGDLSISFLKRKAKIKDTGKFLPGHGGILDRLDGILIALPVGIILTVY
tara:strand:- start:1717 stop:2361 length:645 start_codon:yes stop_codon:yes gene_type:complete